MCDEFVGSKASFSSNPFISLRLDSTNEGKGSSGLLCPLPCINMEISATFCWNRNGKCRGRSGFRRGGSSCSVSPLGSP